MISTEKKEVRAGMRKKNDLFKAFMAYKYFLKGKEEEEVKNQEMQRMAALREAEERKNYERTGRSGAQESFF